MSHRNKVATKIEIITKTISLPAELAAEAESIRKIKTRTANLDSELDWSKHVRSLVRKDLEEAKAA